ncbi:hypothetical protein [Halorientalis halophila]|uniref:hypothetical protein n=1 Tax=Halorientalis halophila TaxID=3108499 RepID=UPI00300A495E
MSSQRGPLGYSIAVCRILVLLAVYVAALAGLTVAATGKRTLGRIRSAGGQVVGRRSRPRSSRR